jgi:hypothetical protein
MTPLCPVEVYVWWQSATQDSDRCWTSAGQPVGAFRTQLTSIFPSRMAAKPQREHQGGEGRGVMEHVDTSAFWVSKVSCAYQYQAW